MQNTAGSAPMPSWPSGSGRHWGALLWSDSGHAILGAAWRLVIAGTAVAMGQFWNARARIAAYNAAELTRPRDPARDFGSGNSVVAAGAGRIRVQARHLDRNYDIVANGFNQMVQNVERQPAVKDFKMKCCVRT